VFGSTTCLCHPSNRLLVPAPPYSHASLPGLVLGQTISPSDLWQPQMRVASPIVILLLARCTSRPHAPLGLAVAPYTPGTVHVHVHATLLLLLLLHGTIVASFVWGDVLVPCGQRVRVEEGEGSLQCAVGSVSTRTYKRAR
jgi:hypothetical protein